MEILREERTLIEEIRQRCKEDIEKLKLESQHGEPHWCGCCGNNSVKLSDDCFEDYEAEGKCLICGEKETYTICERCEKWLSINELEEYGVNNKMCIECLEYVTDDYWHESFVGK